MGLEGITALVLGATGAIGKEVLRELISDPRIGKINILSRRATNVENPKVTENIVDFENLSEKKELFAGNQVAFCCLGTTRGKSGAEGFVKLDRDTVHEAAKILKEQNCPHFSLVTSKGANIGSRVLYLKTKGEVEKLVSDLQFQRLSIFRPSLLICDREESRPFEKFMQVLAMGFDWRSKMSIGVDRVAHAMITNCYLEPTIPIEIFEHDEINNLGID